MTKFKNGEPIRLDDANTFVKRNMLLNSFVETTLAEYPEELENDLAKYKVRKKNAFVFDAETVRRFFAEGLNTKYIVVLIGAHPEKEEIKGNYENMDRFKAGSYTVLLTGCEEIKEGDLDLKVVNIDNPVIEYPPSLLKYNLVTDSDEINAEIQVGNNTEKQEGYFQKLISVQDLESFENEVRQEYKENLQI